MCGSGKGSLGAVSFPPSPPCATHTHARPLHHAHAALRRVAAGGVCRAWRAASLELALWAEVELRVEESNNLDRRLEAFLSFLIARKDQARCAAMTGWE